MISYLFSTTVWCFIPYILWKPLTPMSTSRGFKDISSLVSPTKKVHKNLFKKTFSTLSFPILPLLYQFHVKFAQFTLPSFFLTVKRRGWWTVSKTCFFFPLVSSLRVSLSLEGKTNWSFPLKKRQVEQSCQPMSAPLRPQFNFQIEREKNNDRNIVDCVCGWWFKSRRFKMPSDDIDNRIKT